jgi:hypothetical protein
MRGLPMKLDRLTSVCSRSRLPLLKANDGHKQRTIKLLLLAAFIGTHRLFSHAHQSASASQSEGAVVAS